MKFKRSEHSRFIQWLDRTAEKNPLLWLPCVALIALALAAEHIVRYAKITYLHRNTEKVVKKTPQPERKPFFLRAVAVTLTAAFSLMLVPVTSFDAFGEEYDHITEQIAFNEVSETDGTSASEETTVPEETTAPEETDVPEETTVPVETPAPEETTVPDEPIISDDPAVTEERPPEVLFPEEEDPVSDPTDDFDSSFLLDSNASVYAVDHTGHRKHGWDANDNYHWRYCEDCKMDYVDMAPHSFPLVSYTAPTATAFGQKKYRCICGLERTESIPKTAETHTYQTAWAGDANGHWHNCIHYPNCALISDFSAHNWGAWQQYSDSYTYRDLYHYRECTICGYRDRYVYHNWSGWKSDSSGHYRTCADCGQEDRRVHDIVDDPKPWDYKYDNTDHWLECSFCGYKKDVTAHDINPDTWQHNNTHHRKGCTVCMYATQQEEHELEWETYDNDQKHRQICEECGAIINDGEHIWQWEKDENEHWQKCRVCPEVKDRSGHTFANEWAADNTYHWHECTYATDGEGHICGQKKDVEAHTPDYDTWYDDEYSHWRKCSECGSAVEKVNHNYTRYHDKTTHWDICGDCGKKDHEVFHSYLEPDYTYDEDGETPIKIFECVDCDYSYIVPVWHEHTFYDEPSYNELGHWYDCKYCDGKIDRDIHKYAAEVTVRPTETEKGTRVYTCKICGYSYSESIPELEHTHTFDTEWHKDKNDHWHECTGCGERTDTAAHVSDGGKITVQPTETSAGVKTYTCTVCGYIIKTESIYAQDTSVYYPPAAAEAPLRLPYVTNVPDVRGWIYIASYINASPNDVTIPITMNGENELPKEIAECIMNRDVTLRIDMGGGPVWKVNGLDVTEPLTVNMRVAERSNKIPSRVIDGLVSEFEPKQYRLYHSGDLGYTAELTLNVGKKYNDYYASLYHYNTKTKQLEFVDESLVENKLVTFELTHASYYAVAFNSIPMYDDVSSGAGVFESSVPIETSAMPETSGVTIPAAKLPQIMKYSNKKRRYRILRKRRLDDLVFVF